MVGVLLAAGMSTRMGSVNKLLLKIKGDSIVNRSLKNILNSRISKTYIVLGYESERIQKQLPKGDFEIVKNPNYENGLVSSLASVSSLVYEESVNIFLADMPYLDSESIDQFLAFCSSSLKDRIVRPRDSQGLPGHPVHIPFHIFSNLDFDASISSLKPLLNQHSEFFLDFPTNKNVYFRDVDTFRDYINL